MSQNLLPFIENQRLLAILLHRRQILKSRLLFIQSENARLKNDLDTLAISIAEKCHCPDKWSIVIKMNFFEKLMESFNNRQWRENFRVSKETYLYLCLRSEELERSNSNYRTSINSGKRVAIALYKLCSSAEYRTVANLFSVGKATVWECVTEFCQLIVTELMEEEIRFPSSSEDMINVVSKFRSMWGYPQCCGAIDGSHIEIKPPKENAACYYNYSSFYSVVLLAVVDAEYKFLYINVGAPGRNNDSHIYRSSALYQHLSSSEILENLAEEIQGTIVPLHLIGDSAFPLQRFLMKPFLDRSNLPHIQKNFNYRLSRARRVVENAFGRLKARFRILQRMDCNVKNATSIIQACSILNNICERNNDYIDPNWYDFSTKTVDEITIVGDNTPAAFIRNALALDFLR